MNEVRLPSFSTEILLSFPKRSVDEVVTLHVSSDSSVSNSPCISKGRQPESITRSSPSSMTPWTVTDGGGYNWETKVSLSYLLIKGGTF